MRQGRHRSARSSSTPAAPTATPARTASRPRTRSPSRSPAALGIGADRRRRLLDRPDRPANDRETGCCAGVDAAYAGARRRRRATTRPHAIMTTDTVAKQAVRRGRRLVGRRHGQGRRACSRPQLATMLVVLTTDAVVDRRPTSTPRCAPATRVTLRPARLRRLHVDQRHRHRCWPAAPAGSRPSAAGLHRRADPGSAPTWPCSCSRDAEGADHDIAITVAQRRHRGRRGRGRPRSVARSNLFKAAVFGNDPNWGRVLASIGTTQAAFDPADLDVAMNGVWVCRAVDAGRRPAPRST